MEAIKKNIIRFLVAAYLLRILIANMGMDKFIPRNWFGHTVQALSNTSHADAVYAFFLENMHARYDMVFDVFKSEDTLSTLSSANKSYGFFTHNADNLTRYNIFKYNFNRDGFTQRLFAKSMSAKILRTVQQSDKVQLTVYKSKYPTLNQYKNGGESTPQQVYTYVTMSNK